MQEIFLGARRPPRSGRFLRRVVLVVLALVILLTIGGLVFSKLTGVTAPAGEAPSGPFTVAGTRLVVGGSSLERLSGTLWVLRQDGPPFALGAEAGRLLQRDGGAALDAALLGDGDGDAGWLTRHWRGAARRWRYRHLEEGLDPAWRAELAGLAAGWRAARTRAPADYRQLVWRQAALDLGDARGTVGGAATGLGFAVSGGRLVAGRVHALVGLPQPTPVVVSFVRPAGRIAFARVGWPGEIGVVTGVSAAGLVLFLDPAVSDDVDVSAAAPPLSLVARDLLERARTLEEAVSILRASHPLGSGTFLLLDGKQGTWAVVERTPRRFAVTRNRPVIGDVLDAAEHARDAENDRVRRGRVGSARLARLVELLGRETGADGASVAAVLRDRRGRGDTALPLGSGAAIDDLAPAHVAVIDAAALVLWVGDGPGAAGALRPFDLRHELLGETPRPVQPIPADSTVDLDAARAVVLARGLVAEGARAGLRGRWTEAAEAAARALALAPELPAANKLAGDAARARGDAVAARDHYRRTLDGSPGDPVAERDARASLGEP